MARYCHVKQDTVQALVTTIILNSSLQLPQLRKGSKQISTSYWRTFNYYLNNTKSLVDVTSRGEAITDKNIRQVQ